MKKLFLTLMALAATMSIDAQMIKVYEGGQLVLKYRVVNSGKVVLEEASPTTGTAYAEEPDCEIGWVQLWEDGLKFAVCNVGAKNNEPEDSGGYYTWGGTYKNGTGIEWNGAYNTGTVVLEGENDTATKLWGKNWRMMTIEEFGELTNNKNCTCTWTTRNGINGLLCKGKEGTAYASNSIFLPAAGYNSSGVCSQGSKGYYWSSTPSPTNSGNAYYLNFGSDRSFNGAMPCNWGFSVRAVLSEVSATDGNER